MPTLLDRITIDASICHGKPCIRGLRYPVEMILELMSGGATADDILHDYEDLEREDILAALAFAARLAQAKRIEPPAAMKFLIDAQLPRRLARLFLVSVGNVGNAELEARFFATLPASAEALSSPGFVELTLSGLVIHQG